MPTPADLKLYEKIKKKVYKEIPLHSAYRSGLKIHMVGCNGIVNFT